MTNIIYFNVSSLNNNNNYYYYNFLNLGYYLYLVRFLIFLNLIVIIGLIGFIKDNGTEFINWPSLVLREYLNKTSSSLSFTNKHLESKGSTGSKYGEKIE